MGVSRRILATSVAALTAGGAFVTVSPAGDAASGPARSAGRNPRRRVGGT